MRKDRMPSRTAFAATALLLAGCRDSAPAPETNIVAEEGLPPIPDIVPAAGCADRWTVRIDPESFARNGAMKVFPKERLAAFTESVTAAAKGAVGEACKAGEVTLADAAGIDTLTVFSASGADSPVFFGDRAARALRLEYVFAEADLAIPSEMELRAGLVCWTDPTGDTCAGMAP